MLDGKEVLEKAILIHNGLYSYPNWKYKGMLKNHEIECKKHGIFKQTMANHIHHKKGCGECAGNIKKSFEQHVEECRIKHNNRYDYPPNQSIKNNKSKINIICKEHGMFPQPIDKHKSGSNCPKCVGGVSKKQEEFILESKSIHSGLSYGKVNYINSQTEVTLICDEHGDFNIRPNDHVRGQRGCKKCAMSNISKPEIEVQEFVKSLGFEILPNNRKIIAPKELDIYIPSLNKAIEFKGSYWHYSNKKFKPGKHAQKSNLCREKGIKLLHIRQELWLRNKNKMLEVIKNFLENN